jgi:hypothetical protein
VFVTGLSLKSPMASSLGLYYTKTMHLSRGENL